MSVSRPVLSVGVSTTIRACFMFALNVFYFRICLVGSYHMVYQVVARLISHMVRQHRVVQSDWQNLFVCRWSTCDITWRFVGFSNVFRLLGQTILELRGSSNGRHICFAHVHDCFLFFPQVLPWASVFVRISLTSRAGRQNGAVLCVCDQSAIYIRVGVNTLPCVVSHCFDRLLRQLAFLNSTYCHGCNCGAIFS